MKSFLRDYLKFRQWSKDSFKIKILIVEVGGEIFS